MIPYRFRKIWNPEMFQGYRKKSKYFEGWYFKLVSNKEDNIYAIIPGISIDRTGDSSHCFIQIINGKTYKTKYIKFPIDNFNSSKDEFKINVGNNVFTSKKMKLNINRDDITVSGEIEFHNIKPWPIKLLSPGIMGWYTFVPFMECYHGVLSLNHSISGEILLDNKYIDFDDGKGYIEKDWGTSFPSAWLWIQSNHFQDTNLSLIVSIAKIPWLGSSFRGFIIGVLHNGNLYRFTTYSGAKIKDLNIDKSHVQIKVVSKKHVIYINATKASGGILNSPSRGVMNGKVNESINSKVKIILYDRNSGEKLIEDKGRNAGMEIANADELSERV